MAENKKTLSKEALRKTCLRALTWHRVSNSLEYLYGCGVGYAMMPVLEELYGDNPEALKEAALRHTAPYISEMNLGNCILGAAVAMEEERANGANIPVELISSTKSGLMGPFAGFGDTLLYGTLAPIIRTIFLAFALEGAVIGCFGEVVERVICFVIGIVTFYKGYEAGRKSLLNILKDNRVQDIMTFAAILGMFMMGAMAAQYTTITTSLAFTLSGKEFVVQSMLDKLLPGLLPFVVLVICYRYMSKGGNYLKLLLIILAVCIVGALLKVF
ncbi:MAG: PTS system mannose/fructose/sorbose family transporter subunit IID [Erysipelotrichaceae bacterium]|nr:PTS system mannose/fructose/sorbose family transporter subunit IID [Erysipelotrichaceae bacterium]